jgi:hypothetical protein
MEPLNNSFPCYFSRDDNMEVDIEERMEKSNLSAFNLNFLKVFESVEPSEVPSVNEVLEVRDAQIQIIAMTNEANEGQENSQCQFVHPLNMNFSPPKKKNSIDISYSMEQTFYENEEEFQHNNTGNEETYLKIGNEGQNPCIDPIQEVDSFERENNESFLFENNYLLDNFNNDITNSFEFGSSTGVPSEFNIYNSTLEETDISKMRKNIMSLKLSKMSMNLNKSDWGVNFNNNFNKKQYFSISNSSAQLNLNGLNKSNSLEKNIILTNNSSSNLNLEKIHQTPRLNLSCSLFDNFSSVSNNKKRGRKKFLFDGVKTEILDKAFLREFKSYLKKSKTLLRNVYEELKPEEKLFWNEFMQNNNPPFFYTQNRQKVEYKSFSKSLLKFIFSHSSLRNLYSVFVKEREKDIINSIIDKKIKKIDRKMLLFYSFYGKNLHKLYSSDYSINDFNTDDLENLLAGSNSNISQSASDSFAGLGSV